MKAARGEARERRPKFSSSRSRSSVLIPRNFYFTHSLFAPEIAETFNQGRESLEEKQAGDDTRGGGNIIAFLALW